MNLIRKFNNHNLEVISVDKIIFPPGPETPEPEGVMKKIPDKLCQKKNFVHIALTGRVTFNSNYVILWPVPGNEYL